MKESARVQDCQNSPINRPFGATIVAVFEILNGVVRCGTVALWIGSQSTFPKDQILQVVGSLFSLAAGVLLLRKFTTGLIMSQVVQFFAVFVFIPYYGIRSFNNFIGFPISLSSSSFVMGVDALAIFIFFYLLRVRKSASMKTGDHLS